MKHMGFNSYRERAGIMRRMMRTTKEVEQEERMTKEVEEEEMMTEEEFPACGPRPSAGTTRLLTSMRMASIPPHQTLIQSMRPHPPIQTPSRNLHPTQNYQIQQLCSHWQVSVRSSITTS